MKNLTRNIRLPFLLALTVTSCMSPRNITNTGKVTPKGNFIAGADMSANIPTQTIGAMKDIIVQTVDDLANHDTIFTGEELDKVNRAAIAYALDPLKSGVDYYFRYGIFKRVDIGFKYTGNCKAFDIQYQMFGSTGNIKDKTKERLYGSIGIQYSAKKQELPSLLSKLQDRLGYTFERKDILIPVIFSLSFGNEEEYGSFSFGFALSYSNIKYSATPSNIYNFDEKAIMGIKHVRNYLSYGTFVSIKGGYRFVYIMPSIALYKQNYGNYQLLSGNSVHLKGWTVVPSIGLKFRIGKGTCKKKQKL